MPRVNIIYDIQPEYIVQDTETEYEIKMGKDRSRHIKVSEKVFDLMVSEGMIKKTDDGYVFVAKYDEVKKLKK